MDELTKELNGLIGQVRAYHELLSEPHWIVVDTRCGIPERADWFKSRILEGLAKVDLTLTMRVNQINGIALPQDDLSTGKGDL